MITSNTVLSGLGLAMAAVRPEVGDSDVSIPATILNIIDSITPLSQVTSTIEPSTSSKTMMVSFAAINAVSGFQDQCVLTKGLWTFEFNISIRSNFTTVVLSDRFQFLLRYQGFDSAIAVLHANTEVARLEGSVTYLLTSNAVVRLTYPATNAVATNAFDLVGSFNMIKRL